MAFPGEKDGSGFQQPIFDDHRPDLRDHNEGLDEYQRGVTDCELYICFLIFLVDSLNNSCFVIVLITFEKRYSMIFILLLCDNLISQR